MTTVIVKKRSITTEGVLRLLNDGLEAFFPLSRKQAYRNFYQPKYIALEDYFPSVVLRAANQLKRRGLVQITETPQGRVVKITDQGKSELLKFDILNFKPKSGKWDGKWRVVFFDIPREENGRRDKLRTFLKMLGLKMMQESVWVSPYDVSGEVKYIREALKIPDRVKLAEMSYLENSEELKELFEV